jgi:hypothetical protein
MADTREQRIRPAQQGVHRHCHRHGSRKSHALSRLGLLFKHDLRANGFSRYRGEKPLSTPHQVRGRLFSDHALPLMRKASAKRKPRLLRFRLCFAGD